MTNALLSRNAGTDAALFPRQREEEELADTEQMALQVSPRGVPSRPTVVTTVTPVGKEPRTARKSCPSMAKVISRGRRLACRVRSVRRWA